MVIFGGVSSTMLAPKTEKKGWEGGSVGKHEDLSLNPQESVKYGRAHQKVWETETGIVQVLASSQALYNSGRPS